MKSKVTSLAFNLLGFICFGLGAAGVVLPLLPTTPFLLLACFCFAKGSVRFHNWMSNTRFYKKYLSEFAKTRAMTIKTKLTICLTATALVSIPFILAQFWVIRLIIACVLAFKWYFFIFRIKTMNK